MTVALLGDVALHGRFGLNRVTGTPPVCIERVGQALAKFDLVVANLETPLVEDGVPFGAKSAHLGARPEDVSVLEALGIHAVSLANNHTFDFGERGFDQTLDALDRAGIASYGHDGKTVRFGTPGNEIELSGFCCYSANPVGLDPARGPARLHALSLAAMTEAVRRAVQSGAYPVVSVHWGEEHVHSPRWAHVELARRVAMSGSYTLHGHHPHVLQGLEEHESSLLAYSLGNFCFDEVHVPGMRQPLVRSTPASMETGYLSLTLRGGALADWTFHPLRFNGTDFVEAPEVRTHLNEYSARLPAGPGDRDKFERVRGAELAEHRARRLRERSLEWLLYRLRYRTVLNRLEARRNRALCRELVELPLSQGQ